MNKLVQKNMLQFVKQRSSIVSNQVRLMSLMTNSHIQ
jgi:cold-inducible RNA-binding protein